MIRRAKIKDIEGINRLLCQVLEVHSKGRPDLFKEGTKKYTDYELKKIIADDLTPVFVYDEGGRILGYCFAIFESHPDSNILTDIKTLYIDDLCVDETVRGQHIGKKLYEYMVKFAREKGCYNLTLNVWALNPGAIKFYESCNMKVQKIGMETIL